MLTKANINWSVKQFVKMIKNGKISFENAVQRGYVWDDHRSSLFIHSLLTGYPVPPVFAVKGENGTYDMLDGKQRLTTLFRFCTNDFALTEDTPCVDYMIDGEAAVMPISQCKYENLPEELRDDLDGASITLYYFDGITEDEIAEMFYRLNNGQAIQSSVITRVRAMSKNKIRELGQNSIFEMALTKKALEAYTNEDIVIKGLHIMAGNTDLSTKAVRKWISETEVTDEMQVDLSCCFGRLKECAEIIAKEDKKLAKKILTKVHLISLLPVIDKSREEKVKTEDLVNWLKGFYGTEERTSVSTKYNDACSNGANRKEAVETRLSELEKSFNKMLDKKNK